MKKLFKEIKDCLKWTPVIIIVAILNLVTIFGNDHTGVFLIGYPILELNLALFMLVVMMVFYSISTDIMVSTTDRKIQSKLLVKIKEEEELHKLEDAKKLQDYFKTFADSKDNWTYNEIELTEFLLNFKKDVKFKSESFKKSFH